MKRLPLVLIAVITAIGLSSFTTKSPRTLDKTVTYRDSQGEWQTFDGEPCDGDMVPECIKLTPDGFHQLFYNNDDNDPVYRN